MKRLNRYQSNDHGFGYFRLEDDRDLDLPRSNPPRTKAFHPCAYDPFTIWGDPHPSKKCNGTDYTDQLDRWDPAKYDQLAKKHYRSGESDYARPFAEYACKGDLIQAFLRDWHDDPKLELLRVIEYCDASTGYSTWRLDYRSTKAAAR